METIGTNVIVLCLEVTLIERLTITVLCYCGKWLHCTSFVLWLLMVAMMPSTMECRDGFSQNSILEIPL